MDELLDEIMRRAEERWGDGAPEGPYCRQEIVEGLREIIEGIRPETQRVIEVAARVLVDEGLLLPHGTPTREGHCCH